jgi:L-fuconolactonase
MIVDSHQHFWDRSLKQFDNSWQEDPKLAKICHSFLPADLQPLLQANGVDKCVFVQTQHNVEENRWALGLADHNDFVAGVVGWVDLTSAECEDQLLEFKDHPKFVGIRHVTQDEADDDFIVRDDVSRGLAVLEKHGVPFDLLFYTKHLKHTATVADQLPNLPLVIDHLSKPEIKIGNIEQWRKDLANAAQRENVYCKLSGMATEADWETWKPSDLKPYVDTAIELFTPERLMFGSDWPVCKLAADYGQVFDALKFCIRDLSQAEQDAILGKTAIQFYGLDDA